MTTKVLILTTQDPSSIKAEWPYYQNWTLPQKLEEAGAAVTIRCWQDPTLDSHAIAQFDVVTFLWCNNYHLYAVDFIAFLEDVLVPAQQLSPALKVVNDTALILWNIDKKVYLPDLSAEGFLVPKTVFADSVRGSDTTAILQDSLSHFPNADSPLVLKPSISGSSKQTHLIKSPSHLRAADKEYLSTISERGLDGSLVIQAYEPGIENGEYSLVFIAGRLSHTMLKTPSKGEFRCQSEFGGDICELERCEVPALAVKTAWKVVRLLERRFLGLDRRHLVYVRVDGVVRQSGEFVIMEVEAIEPHLWLETSCQAGGYEPLCEALLGSVRKHTALNCHRFTEGFH